MQTPTYKGFEIQDHGRDGFCWEGKGMYGGYVGTLDDAKADIDLALSDPRAASLCQAN